MIAPMQLVLSAIQQLYDPCHISSFFTLFQSDIPSIDLSVAHCVICNRLISAAINAIDVFCTIEKPRFCFSLNFTTSGYQIFL